MMVTLVVEFGRQRRKFQLKHPIDVDLLENEIKSNFGIDHRTRNDYFVQIYDEQIQDYLDLTSNSFESNQIHLFKGQILSRQSDQTIIQTKVSKQQVVGLITLESAENSLQKWAQLLQHIQLEINKELQTIRETIVAVKAHYQLVDQINPENVSPIDPILSNCSSPSTVSQSGKKNRIKSSPMINNENHSTNSYSQQKHQTNGNHSNQRRGTFNHNRDYHSTQIPSKSVEYNIPVTVTYQRFQNGVTFQGELSKYYNPTYLFLQISNQRESYDEMHRDLNLYYNSIDSNQSYFPQSGEFCVAKSPTDSNWYRSRIIRLVGNEKAQLIFIDSGQLGEINVNFIQPLNRQFSDRPAQALACTLAQVIPFTQNDKCGWNRRACMSLENALKNERLTTGKLSLKVTVADNNQVKWPMMFVHISTETIPNVSDHMCDLYLSRRCTNVEVSEYWSSKIRPEQYVLYNLSSLINQKQYFLFNKNSQATLSFDQAIDLIINDPEFISRQ